MVNRNSSTVLLLTLVLSCTVFLSSVIVCGKENLRPQREALNPAASSLSVQDSFPNTLATTGTDANVTQGGYENAADDSVDYIGFYAFTLYSPLNRTYYSSSVPIEISFTAGLGIKYTISYTLDGTYGGTIPFEVENSTELHVMYPAKGYLMLPELSDGSHNLTITLFASGYQMGYPYFTGSVQFTIDTQNQPADYIRFYAFTLYSPINRTYNSKSIPLDISFSAGWGSYTLTYTLDGGLEGAIPFEIENSTELHAIYPAHGHLMLPELSEGNHNLTINMLCPSGYFTGSVQFTINTQNQPDDIPEFNSSSILLFMMSAAVIVVWLRKKSVTQNGDEKQK
ncbi:MAG: hypothetical protein CW716_08980 [Candidatus Bathyarchaeum sp.]|nr:MAG: hypothetical protein CW716_08980 [Candidatus Bathyarchaeum sp.]